MDINYLGSLTTVQIVLIVVWGVIAVTCIGIEIFATNFIALWFSVGSVGAIILAAFNIEWYFQLITFVLISGITLAIFYPLLRKKLIKTKPVKTNIDDFVGRKIKITKLAGDDNLSIDGYTRISGIIWSIKHNDNKKHLHKNDIVVVEAVKGTTLIVRNLKDGD